MLSTFSRTEATFLCLDPLVACLARWAGSWVKKVRMMTRMKIHQQQETSLVEWAWGL